MTKAQQLYSRITDREFSYGESIAMIMEERGRAISALPEEDFVFDDNSVLRITNTGPRVLEYLSE